MCTQDLIGNGILPGLVRGEIGLFGNGFAAEQINTMRNKFYHNCVIIVLLNLQKQ